MEQPARKDVIRTTDADAIDLAKRLIRTARYGAIAVVDPETGEPLASRVGVSTSEDGAPQILVSSLAVHTQALLKDPRCSILLGEPGKGDPLAYPRITVVCHAQPIARDDAAWPRAIGRHLLRQPKAKLYVQLPDFFLVRLQPLRANLNGGFGKAYHLTGPELLSKIVPDQIAALEHEIGSAFEVNSPDVTNILARLPTGAKFAGIDSEGIDFTQQDVAVRLRLTRLPDTVGELHDLIDWSSYD